MTRSIAALFICTGNICRSPVAERLVQHLDRPNFTAESAGTHSLAGSPIDPPMARLLEERGADPSGFVARTVTRDIVRDADVILTMTTEHRRRIVDLLPLTLGRVFQLTEFAWLVDRVAPPGSPPVSPGELLDEVIAQRPRLISSTGFRPTDIDDPYRGGARSARRAFDEISQAIEVIAKASA